MRKWVFLTGMVLVLFASSAAQLPAAEQNARPATVVTVETASGVSAFTAPILAQYSSNNSYSSSGSTRIPRGAIKLGIFLVIGFISLCGWALKRVLS